jgi:serine/threonine-protein kinase
LAGDLDTITLHALRKEPERRYSSVEQFAADIDRYVGNMPVVAREDSVGYRTSRFVRRHRYGVAAAAVVILTLVLGIVTTAWQARVASRQRDAAEAERAKAERINKFLQEMLSYSNQSWTSSVSTGQKRDITINEMLDDIGPRLDTELADQPEMRSRIFYTIGSAYNSQGRYDTAEQYLRKALDLARPLYGETSTETMDILAALGETTFQTGRPDEGEKIYAELVDIMRRREATIENGKYRLAAALHGLGSERLMKGDAAGAIPVMRDAAATAAAAQLPGNERGLLAEIKLNLAGALIATGELNESETLLRESLAIFRELPGDPRWEMGVTLTRLGDCLVRKGEYAEGEAMLLEGEQIYLKTLGPSSHYLARNYNIRALAGLNQNEFLQAKTKSRQSLDILGKLSPQPETVRARALFTLGIALCKTKRSSEGTQLLREALALYQRNNAAEANDVATSLLECSGN